MEYHSGGSLPLLGRPRYCPGANANGGYLCETGHCCGETGCCTYYYELWWFWLLWTVLILFSCCCAYRHRRAKLRVQQQQRQREISLLAYHGANSFPSSMLDLSFLASLKLPSYEEVAAQPSTPPPPYSSVFTTPRYPQPPRAADPHLLTQHGPLLHRPLSDGPSSLSSDNSSSCSCDSCCPSSPCSSSLSAPITYETDTSHASTPSEATPLTLDVTMETIAAAASCLEANETQFSSERTAATVAIEIEDAEATRAQEPNAKESSLPSQTVTTVVVTRAASPQRLPSPGAELTLPVATTSPINLQVDTASHSPVVSTGSSSSLPSPSAEASQLSCIKVTRTGSVSGPPTPTANLSESCTAALSLTRTLNPASVPCSPAAAPIPDVHRTLAFQTTSAILLSQDQNISLVPVVDPAALTQTSLPTNPTQEPPLSDLTQAPDLVLPTLTPDSIITLIPTPKPTYLNLTQDTDVAPVSSSLTQSQNPERSPGSGLVQILHSPGSGLSQHSASVATVVSCLDLTSSADDSGSVLVPDKLSEPNLIPPLPSDVQADFRSGSGSPLRSSPLSTLTPVLACPAPEATPTFCPAITIEPEASHSPLAVLSPSSPRSPPSLAAPALLLDPLTALQQSDKGGSSSGHASSLSPSPRATQSPPKQTVFSPCVDVFEPGPPSWEDGEEEQDDKDNDEDEDDDMGADESQYRHRRLTGDSGIEVCRCRVEEEDDDEEEEKEDGRRRGGGNTEVHDSVDCPARGQMSTGDELSLCTPTAAVTTPTSDDSSKVVIVMENV
ncbi:flocculation protein FLO11-like [Kryptolebias marmoratus]|uniref:Si:ch73-290k24.6 n=1 Tax=Kryptolebias marmoratus TaxID=37003 RepID=A0A3Q3EQZ0_KRYMA|nr:flocculation protein FLO11-like [Kryptolebias marmoratus]XP_017297395.1 flocculation protein FLO11-like [Kryptolebias marmoratus]